MPAGATIPIAPTLIASLSRRTWIALALIMTIVWFANLDLRKLQHPDEGRYAEIAREMVATGNWVTPRLNGIKYFEKPALQYWLTAASFEAFGVGDGTARLRDRRRGLPDGRRHRLGRRRRSRRLPSASIRPPCSRAASGTSASRTS